MTVDNVKALSPFGTVQGSQTSAKPEEFVQDRFDKLMTKMSDELAGLQKSQAAAQAQAPKQSVQAAVGKAQESAQPKDTAKQESTGETAGTEKPEDAKTAADGAENKTAEGEKSEAAAKTEDGKTADAATQETVEEAAEKLVAEIVEVMQIPLEKVEEAMEVLGLTAVDLFDPANLKQLLLQITESTDELTLVTDETLYGNLRELFTAVQETLSDLQEELGLAPEELEKLVTDLSEAKREPVEVLQPDVQTAVGEEPEVSVEGMKDYAVSVAKDGGTVQIKVTVDDASGEKHVSEQVTQEAKPEITPVMKKSDMGEGRHGQEDSHAGEQSAGNVLLQHTNGQTTEIEAPAEQPVYTQPETNQIMDQIVEYMKINIRPETQEMEMQLHPASLGTVHVQIAAKDGVITAQFAAQNETVKAVLETQMIQLKQQFEEQGIKVEAVEVTVANHSYGEQYGDGQDAADQQHESAKKNGTRRINLDEFDEEEIDELEDSERIAVEMMQASGSTVDYTA
ncbi:MAG: flagellar hook-length control protein FliK [Bacteroidales bacterium]|nr:flagellar hook-length control protein FliK [Bacteroidales bacterium]MCM1415142.1 flagellar hook-length control protein FliK [bacterium]MCM1423022.1 flagellar hook-length control protein FliK [bacterium]